MILVHGFAGAITTYFILKNKSVSKLHKNFTEKQYNILWAIGSIGGIFPDFDLIIAFLNRLISHRRLVTHSLIPYTVLFLVINILLLIPNINSKFSKNTKDFIKLGNLVFYIAVISHLILDYFVGGLVLFSPFTDYYFGYPLPFDAKSPVWQYQYFTSGYAIAEGVVALLFFTLFSKINNKVGKYLPIFLFFIACAMTLVFMYL